ncbi:hypothetical protein T01_9683 [Trichinella spiralis]|uniref:Uncharacterized protein n=1 Tax=Trichinella spiralis TaxID=6334 RepID=A0A0V1AZV3_TRISP|nr:hypothetical protein T01_9683 [Trichinella spiralis]
MAQKFHKCCLPLSPAEVQRTELRIDVCSAQCHALAHFSIINCSVGAPILPEKLEAEILPKRQLSPLVTCLMLEAFCSGVVKICFRPNGGNNHDTEITLNTLSQLRAKIENFETMKTLSG